MNSVTVTWTLVVKLILWSFLLCLTFVSLREEATQKNDNASFLCILQILCVLNLELFLCMSCLGLLVHAVRRTLPVLPYVCPHTSLVPLSHCLWGAGHCTGMDPWDSAGPSLPHPQGMEALYPSQTLYKLLKWLFRRNNHWRITDTTHFWIFPSELTGNLVLQFYWCSLPGKLPQDSKSSFSGPELGLQSKGHCYHRSAHIRHGSDHQQILRKRTCKNKDKINNWKDHHFPGNKILSAGVSCVMLSKFNVFSWLSASPKSSSAPNVTRLGTSLALNMTKTSPYSGTLITGLKTTDRKSVV